jgi:hypothetical protein
MIDSLRIENFRCYESLQLHALKRINVIVGKNASGKTALLEAVFLAAGGSPELPLRLRAWRGMGQQLQVPADRRAFESLWRDLFYSLDQSRKISLQISGSDENTGSLEISYSNHNVLTLPLETSTGEPPAAAFPLQFDWTDFSGKTHKGRIKFGGARGFELEAVIDTIRCAFFPEGWAATQPQEHSARFSDLSLQNEERPVVKALIDEFPFIQGLGLEIVGGTTLIHASVKGTAGKIPVGAVSGGVMKFLYLLLAIATLRHGVLLVDEIENGFYYDRLPQLWLKLVEFCTQKECQLFVTSHSWECLKAMLPAVERCEDDFSLIRTVRSEQGTGAQPFSGKTLLSLLRQGFDPRG